MIIKPPHLLGDNDGRKPADLFVKKILNGKDVFDVTVTSVAIYKRKFQAYGRRENVKKLRRKAIKQRNLIAV